MNTLDDIESLLEEYVAPFYASRDTMHDASHIRRITRKALQIAEKYPCNVVLLRIAAQLHGILDEETNLRTFLAAHGLDKPIIDQIILVARESETGSSASTLEGSILHDAHLLEGDENFMITKSLVTGSARGQSLMETVGYLERHLGIYQCCLSENQSEYERRVNIARRFLNSLKPEM